MGIHSYSKKSSQTDPLEPFKGHNLNSITTPTIWRIIELNATNHYIQLKEGSPITFVLYLYLAARSFKDLYYGADPRISPLKIW